MHMHTHRHTHITHTHTHTHIHVHIHIHIHIRVCVHATCDLLAISCSLPSGTTACPNPDNIDTLPWPGPMVPAVSPPSCLADVIAGIVVQNITVDPTMQYKKKIQAARFGEERKAKERPSYYTCPLHACYQMEQPLCCTTCKQEQMMMLLLRPCSLIMLFLILQKAPLSGVPYIVP